MSQMFKYCPHSMDYLWNAGSSYEYLVGRSLEFYAAPITDFFSQEAWTRR